MPKYIAKQSVGHFRPGEEIQGLEVDHLQALLVSGVIEEYKAPEETPSDESTSDLKKLLGEVADLKASNTKLAEAKDKALGEVADLKASNTKLAEAKDKALGEVADLKASNTKLAEAKDKALGEVADLKASNTKLAEAKDKALGEVADLTAKVKKLETDLAAATAKSSKTGKATADETAEKGAPESAK